MKYVNKITGNVIETHGKIQGKNWVEEERGAKKAPQTRRNSKSGSKVK